MSYMPRYSLNPDGSLKIEDDSINGFVVFGKTVKTITKILSVLIVLSSLAFYGLVYYNNDPNEIIHAFITGNGENVVSCYNVKTAKSAITIELNHIARSSEDIAFRIESGAEWIAEHISEFRKDVSY